MKIEKLTRILNNRSFFLLLYATMLVIALIPYYTNGCLILGGEGNYVLDFSIYLKNFGFTWFPTIDTGTPNMASGSTGLNILLLYLIEKLTGSVAITNFVLIFSIYFFPFFAMYLVCKVLKVTPFVSFLISLFYVVNPFMLYELNSLNQWNLFSISIMPLFLWIILKYYHSNFRLFFFFGLISTCFSFAYTNPPMLAIIHISILLSMFMVSCYYNEKIILTQIFKKYSIVLISFIIFNSWWILILFFGGGIATAKKIYPASFAESWLNITVHDAGAIIAKTFSLTTIIANDPSYDFFSYLYNTIFGKLITLVPIFIIVYFILIIKDKRTRNLLNCVIFCMLLIVLFFVKGNASPFGFIYNFMFKHVPLFYIFKTPMEKFTILYLFILSVLLLFIMIGIKGQRHYKLFLGIFTVYLIFCSLPLLTGNIIPDYRFGYGYASRKYRDKVEYEQARELINNDDSQYRVLILPGSGNYQVCMLNWNNRYYTGIDPLIMNTNKSFITAYSGLENLNLLFYNISLKKYNKLLGLYSIKKIMINEDLLPWFGFLQKRSIPELKKIFDKSMTSEEWGSITFYDNRDYFLPHISISGRASLNTEEGIYE